MLFRLRRFSVNDLREIAVMTCLFWRELWNIHKKIIFEDIFCVAARLC